MLYSSFRKKPHKTPILETLRTTLINIYRVPCESVRWFWILVRTKKNWPSSVIIRLPRAPYSEIRARYSK